MPNDRIRVLIATTQGPVDVDAILNLESGEASIVALGSTAQVISGLMTSYRAFVAKGSGVIARSFGHDAFRLELSSEIHAGDSWQLAVFLAHALQKQGRLAEAGEAASTVVWATGQVDYQLRVAEIGHIPEKIAGSLARFAAERERDAVVRVVWPRANGADADEMLRERLNRLGIAVHEADQVGDVLSELGVPWVEAAGPRAPAWEGSPYRGLAPFGEAERTIFFGRGRAREEALARLRTAAAQGVGFLLIHGGSGAGKSSLARAGLIGDIVAEADEADAWRAIVLPAVQPDRPPLRALAQALAGVLPELFPEDEDREDLLIGDMRDDPGALIEQIVEILKPASGRRRAKLVLVVDQLEDVLLYGVGASAPDSERTLERDQFAIVIERLARSEVAWVLATLRSDLLSRLEDSPSLSRLASDSRLYRLERPNRAALRDMVLGPAQLAGLTFEGKDASGTPLPEILVEAAARSPDSLPLLQFGLDRLYDLRDRKSGAITVSAYARIGGLEGAIGRHAEQRTITAFGDDPVMIRAVEDVILALARPDDEAGAVAARTLALDAGFESEPRERAMAAMATARLVTLDKTAAGGRNLRVTHEALLTNWPRAQNLLKDRRGALELRERLEGQAKAWDGRREDPSYLLQAGRALSAAEDLVEEGRLALSERVRAFVTASSEAARAAADAELRRLKEQARSERRRRQVAVMASGVLLVLAGAAVWFWRDARAESDEAQRQAARAEHNLALATQTANSLVFDLAQKFSSAGLPQSLVKEILDQAIKLENQLLEGGQSSADLLYNQASAVALAAQTLWHVGDLDSAIEKIKQAQQLFLDGSKRFPEQHRWAQGLLVTYKIFGDAMVEKGQYEQALASFRTMLEGAKALVAIDPNNLDWLNDLSQSYDEVGNRLKRDGEPEQALAQFRLGLEAAKTLVAKDPNTPKWKMQLALADRLIGDALEALDRPNEALAAAQEGVDVIRSLIAAMPENTIFKSELASHLHLIGDTQVALKHFDLAMEAYREELGVAEALEAADQDDINRKRPVYDAHKAIGDLEAQLGHRAAALTAYRAALAYAKTMAAAAHDAPDERSILASIERVLGGELTLDGQFDEAEADLSEAVRLTDALAALDPNSTWLTDQANARDLYGDLLMARDRRREAIDQYRKALEILTAASGKFPGEASLKALVLGDIRSLAGALEKDGRHSDAEQVFRDGLTMARGLIEKDADNPVWQRQYASLALELGGALFNNKRYDAAIASLEDGLSSAKALAHRDPERDSDQALLARLSQKLGEAYRQADKLEQAVEMYGQALKIEIPLVTKEPQNTDWIFAVFNADYELGWALEDQGKFDAALAAFRDALASAGTLLRIRPAEVSWLLDLALADEGLAASLDKLKQWDASIQAYQNGRTQLEALVSKQPGDNDKQLELCRLDRSLGDVLKEADRLEEALPIYQQGAAICDRLSAGAATNLGAAKEAYRLAVRIGDAQTRLGQLMDARIAYEHAVTLSKALLASAANSEAAALDLFEAQLDFGDALTNLGRTDDALSAYGEAMAIVATYEAQSQDPDWRNAHARALRQIGYARFNAGDIAGARHSFDQAVAISPTKANVRFARALAAFEARDYAAAIEDFQTAANLEPSWPYYALWLHIARLRAGQDDRRDLETYAATIDKTAWPAPVFALLLGQMQPDEVVAGAAARSPLRQKEQTCEADFYVGLLTQNSEASDEAKMRFEAAVRICPVDFTEGAMARIELAKLTR